ncbi:MAG TPA: hypothetical protein VH877_15465 [Polyangia bacterium]|nr:hypothetical protein [Polyangia bacterium]
MYPRLPSFAARPDPAPLAPNDPAVRLGFITAARRIRHHGSVIVGLLSTSPDLVILPLGLHLARSLAEMAHQPVALLAATPQPTQGLPQSMPDEADVLYTTHWLEPALALLNPRPGDTPAAALNILTQASARSPQRFAHLVADLSHFTAIGDHLGAIEQVDGVVLLARAGATDESLLLGLAADLPPHRQLGVILVGGST